MKIIKIILVLFILAVTTNCYSQIALKNIGFGISVGSAAKINKNVGFGLYETTIVQLTGELDLESEATFYFPSHNALTDFLFLTWNANLHYDFYDDAISMFGYGGFNLTFLTYFYKRPDDTYTVDYVEAFLKPGINLGIGAHFPLGEYIDFIPKIGCTLGSYSQAYINFGLTYRF